MTNEFEKYKVYQQLNNIDCISLPVLTKEQLITRALESEKAIAEKNFISLEDLEREMQNW